MNELSIFSAQVNALWAVGAFLLAWVCLRLLDIVGGHPFSRWLSEATHEARATYYGYRILAICILFGLIVRAPV